MVSQTANHYFKNPNSQTPPIASTQTTQQIHPRDPIAKGVDLRILPLGDSLTWGEGSTDGNGYRLHLSNLITSNNGNHGNNGNTLTYIGTVTSGTMPNNRNEGHGGYHILEVRDAVKPNYPSRPNLILLLAGTNDIVFNLDLPNAPHRLANLIEEIVSECPDAAVLVGTPLPLANPGWMTKISDFNAAVPGVVEKIAAKGKQVALVETGTRVNASYIHQSDGIHPTDEGYALLAAAWYDGIVEAGNKRKWIKEPLPLPSPLPISSEAESQSQPSGTTKAQEEEIPVRVKDVDVDVNGLTLVSAWTPAQVMICAFLAFGLVVTARRVISIISRR